MDYEIRYATADEFAAIAELDGASFGFHYGEQERADAQLEVDPQRVIVAATQGRIVGASAEIPFLMRLPGGSDAPVVGLSWVSVELTHRRHGVLRAMVEHQLRAQVAEGALALILSASEGGIYGRYGFGVATEVRHTVVERRRATLRAHVDTSAVQRLTTDAARDLLPPLYERWRERSPGGVSRDERRWQLTMLDRDYQRQDKSGLFHLVHPDGYVSYRIKTDWGEGDPRHQCWLVDYAPVTDEAHAALWQTLLSMDLVRTIESYRVALDDPIQLMLDDPRGVQTTHLGDSLWIRPLDVGGLLAGRRYAVEVEAVLEVRDKLFGDERFLLRGGPGGAECVRTERSPDAQLDVADVGAVCLGGTRVIRLARAGRIAARDPGLLDRLDLAFGADRQPAHGTPF